MDVEKKHILNYHQEHILNFPVNIGLPTNQSESPKFLEQEKGQLPNYR